MNAKHSKKSHDNSKFNIGTYLIIIFLLYINQINLY
jgi:hypothetical protein